MSQKSSNNNDPRRSLEAVLAAEAARPFGGMQMISGRTLQPFSSAGRMAAENLLDKAARALEAGDSDRARRYADHAARLPFDEHEEAAPAAWAVHQELFDRVVDALEGAEAQDHRWLDAALAVLETAKGPARFDLRDVLADIDQDYKLPPTEQRRIRAAIAPIPACTPLMDLDLSEAELSEAILSILMAAADYNEQLAARNA